MQDSSLKPDTRSFIAEKQRRFITRWWAALSKNKLH